MMNAEAMCIACAMYATDPITHKRQAYENMSEALYYTVDVLNLSDEQKADLYATLEEKLYDSMPFKDAVDTIELALIRCRMPEGNRRVRA